MLGALFDAYGICTQNRNFLIDRAIWSSSKSLSDNQARFFAVKKSRIFFVDAHELVRLGMERVIEKDPRLEFCGQAGDSNQALKQIVELKPDLCITDIKLADGSGLELIQSIRAQVPNCRVLVSSMRDESVFAEKSIDAGASGFVSKTAPVSHLLDAIQQALDGQMMVDRRLQRKMSPPLDSGDHNDSSQIAGLSRREFEVFEMIGQGQGSQEIADSLAISNKTVEAHRQNIRNKLGLRNMAELICRAAVWVDKY